MAISSLAPQDQNQDKTKPVPKSISPSNPVSPPVPGVTPPVATGAPPTKDLRPDQLIDPRTFGQVARSTIKDIPTLETNQMTLTDESARLQEQALNEQQANLVKSEQSRTKLYDDINKQEKILSQTHQNDLQEADPFAPSKQSAAELAQMFGLMTIATFGSGGMGKYHGLATLSAMSGLSQGFKEGNKERFNQEKANYEENLKALESHNQKVEKTFNDAMNLLSKNKELGEQKIKELIALDNSGPISASARAGHYDKVSAYIDGVKKSLEKIKERQQALADANTKLKQEHEFRMSEKEPTFYNLPNGKIGVWDAKKGKVVEVEGGLAGMTKVGVASLKSNASADDVVDQLAKYGVHISDKKNRSIVEDTVAAKANLKELQDMVRNDRSLVGREGQLRQFTDKYYQSFKDGTAVDESNVAPEDQAALRFAKKYASMLTRYERALSGSGRTTVSFQQQYNALLQQNQFNPEGMLKLLDDMDREVTSVGLVPSPKLTSGILNDMTNNFVNRLNDDGQSLQGTEEKAKATDAEVKAYADKYLQGDVEKAKESLRKQGYL